MDLRRNTGVRFVVVVDMRGRLMGGDARQAGGLGLREGEMKLVSKILQNGEGTRQG